MQNSSFGRMRELIDDMISATLSIEKLKAITLSALLEKTDPIDDDHLAN